MARHCCFNCYFYHPKRSRVRGYCLFVIEITKLYVSGNYVCENFKPISRPVRKTCKGG